MMSNYSTSELILLQYTEGFNSQDRFPNYFLTIHSLDANRTIQKFFNDGLISIAPITFTLEKHTIPELKELLSTKGLSTKGNKKTLIQFIVDNIDCKELENYFSDRYYVLTEKGRLLLENNLSPEEYAEVEKEFKEKTGALVRLFVDGSYHLPGSALRHDARGQYLRHGILVHVKIAFLW